MPYIPAPYDACQESVKMSTVTTKSLSGSTEMLRVTTRHHRANSFTGLVSRTYCDIVIIQNNAYWIA